MRKYAKQTHSRQQARIQEVGAGAHAHPWDGDSPFKFKMHYSITFEYQSITGPPPLGKILYPPLVSGFEDISK